MLSRLLPHPANVTPIAAIALFGGAYFSNKRLAFTIPLVSLFLSDLVIGFHRQMGTVYFCFILTVFLGQALRSRKKIIPIALASLTSSILFFAITNFGVWCWDGLYPNTFNGLCICYTAAIPFFRNTILGDLFYCVLLFGGFALAEIRLPHLREVKPSISIH